MSVAIQYGAVKYKSIRAAAEAIAAKSGEPVGRVYIRLYMRKRMGTAKLWSKPRKYTRRVKLVNYNPQMLLTYQPKVSV